MVKKDSNICSQNGSEHRQLMGENLDYWKNRYLTDQLLANTFLVDSVTEKQIDR